MWQFKELEHGVPERDPHEAEFFRLDYPAEAIVREVIQLVLFELALNKGGKIA